MQTSLSDDTLRACERIARDHGLTRRELEVMEMLVEADGHQRIQDALFLSRNTVKTHVLHLHRKLGVHSRNEIVALVRGVMG